VEVFGVPGMITTNGNGGFRQWRQKDFGNDKAPI